MFFTCKSNIRQLFTLICSLFYLASMISRSYSQEMVQSRIVYSPPGTQYSPLNEAAQLLSTMMKNSLKSCAIACNQNILCRIIDYDISNFGQCRLFEGNINTVGSIIASSSSQSRVGVVQISSNLFSQYGLSCNSSCRESRYLTCNTNSTCQCMIHTYWNQSNSMCMPQLPIIGASCQQNLSMCRQDLNYTCLSSNQCGHTTIETTTSILSSKRVTTMRTSTLTVTTPSNATVEYQITTSFRRTSIQTSVSNTPTSQLTNKVSSPTITTTKSTGISIHGITKTSIQTTGSRTLTNQVTTKISASLMTTARSTGVSIYTTTKTLVQTSASMVSTSQAKTGVSSPIVTTTQSTEISMYTTTKTSIQTSASSTLTNQVTTKISASTITPRQSTGVSIYTTTKTLIQTSTSLTPTSEMTTKFSSKAITTTRSTGISIYTILTSSIHMTTSMIPTSHVSTKVSSSSITTRQSTRILTYAITSTSPNVQLLNGTTVAGYDNMSSGNDAMGLDAPRGIYVSPVNEALYVCDSNNFRVQRFYFGSRIGVTVAGGFGTPQRNIIMNRIWNVFVDSGEKVYVADRNLARATRWPPNATANVTQGAIISTGVGIWGIALDPHGNLYTSLFDVHIVRLYNGTVIAGQYNNSGNSSTKLYFPRGIFFDNNSSSLFVCDGYNHRIQKFKMNSSIGVTVAGGNGQGSDPNQLNDPCGIWVSSKTGFMYIADTGNNRIQRWKINDTQAVTIAGNGTSDSLTTMFSSPTGVALNFNETFIYVSDQGNNRVQRFKLLL